MAVKPMHNHFYKLLLKNKFQQEDNLKYLAQDEHNQIVYPNILLANLFLIDFDTVSKEEYTEEDMKKILALIDGYRADPMAVVNLSPEQALEIVSFSKKARVSYEWNREIALDLAEEFNKDISDSFFKYRLDILEDVCNLIEENHG